ncbi:MAG: thiamine-phosphate kinase [Candidatus Mycalebacterium zealandia]|nr:MAG: thiamine-phosphate kinase [Candidatus Mycalebacterium zealandia]
MNEDIDSSDHTDSPHKKTAFADEEFVVSRALRRFASKETRGRLVVGPGDDAAVIDCGADEFIVDSCDCVVEGVHFRKQWLSLPEFGARAVGSRAVLCAASDIAAMGASPKSVLVSAGVNPRTDSQIIDELLQGIEDACAEIGAAVAGGNTSSAPFMFLDIKVSGETSARSFARNSGAKSGDAVFVTGRLGGSDAAVKILDGLTSGAHSAASELGTLERFRFPSPRIDAGLALAGMVSAMTDISDGLIADLRRVVSLSGCGARLSLEKIPVHPGLAGGAMEAVTAGGDYELVFTASADRTGEIAGVSKKTGLDITQIGSVDGGGALSVFDGETEIPASEFGPGGYVHNDKNG